MIKNLFLLIVLITVINIGCDKIENPVVKKENTINTDLYPGEGDYVIPAFGAYPSSSQNVLIEDFTGHQCGNCPSAATIAHDLKEEYTEQVFVASIHASPPPSHFQRVNEEGDPGYPAYNHDFKTEAGTQYSIDIGEFFANPSGLINRITTSNGQIWQFHPTWSQIVGEILDADLPLQMNVQVNTNYYTETRGLFIHVQSESFANIEGRYNMVVYLIQNEVIDWQLDYTTDPQDVEFYSHKDVLIDNVNGAYGDQLFASTSVIGETFQNNFTYEVPEETEVEGSNPNDDTGLSLIVYLMNRDTYEIIQVIEKSVLITY